MELKELTEKVMKLFEVNQTDEMSKKIYQIVSENRTEVYEKFVYIVEDLSVDWLQKIFQYYEADRKEKKQDYTPVSLARFVGKLAGDSENVIDMCAGSGALTIQKWNIDHDKEFLLYEYDSKVIPFLLLNMAVRNIQCTVCHSDVLQQEVYNTYKIDRGEKYGMFKEVQNDEHFNF